jgi:hypothetical protein
MFSASGASWVDAETYYRHWLPLRFAERGVAPAWSIGATGLRLWHVAAALAVFYGLLGWLRHPGSPRGRDAPQRQPAAEPAGREAAAGRRRGRRARATAGPPPTPWVRRPLVQASLQLLIALSAAGAVARVSFHDETKLSIQTTWFFDNAKWTAFLDTARRARIAKHAPVNGDSGRAFFIHDVNRALYHSGRLPYDMFAYGQDLEGLLLLTHMYKHYHNQFEPRLYKRLADTAYRLGWVNDAEHRAHEMLQKIGDRPWVLQLLAKVNMVKRQPEAARRFLGYLSSRRSSLGAAAWAREWLARMDADPLLADDEGIRRARSNMLTEDFCGPVRSLEHDLLALLKVNRRNRMAFEYLMALYLLAGQVDKVAENIGRLDDFDYPGLPRHYEEALAMHVVRRVAQGDKVKLPASRPIRQETFARLREVNRRLVAAAEAGRSMAEVVRALEPEFGDSYFFYCLCRQPQLFQSRRSSQ